MLLALLHLAVWTRPPVVHGFDLSDCWAFMRYVPAIGPTRQLRLRSEWSNLNSHHKTILSDDFGVGIPTMLLSRAMRVLEFSDTAHVLNLKYPGMFATRSKPKKGPAKMPDYIGRLAGGGFIVLECKGTQDTLSYLDKAIAAGTVQKQNLVALAGTTVNSSIVAGTFVPQWESAGLPTVRFADPDWSDFADAIREMSPAELTQAVVQIAAAKQLALAGASEAAQLLAETPLRASSKIVLRPNLIESTHRAESMPPVQLPLEDDRDSKTLSMKCSIDVTSLARSIGAAATVSQFVTAIADLSISSKWVHRHQRSNGPAQLITPYGTRLALDVSRGDSPFVE